MRRAASNGHDQATASLSNVRGPQFVCCAWRGLSYVPRQRAIEAGLPQRHLPEQRGGAGEVEPLGRFHDTACHARVRHHPDDQLHAAFVDSPSHLNVHAIQLGVIRPVRFQVILDEAFHTIDPLDLLDESRQEPIELNVEDPASQSDGLVVEKRSASLLITSPCARQVLDSVEQVLARGS